MEEATGEGHAPAPQPPKLPDQATPMFDDTSDSTTSGDVDDDGVDDDASADAAADTDAAQMDKGPVSTKKKAKRQGSRARPRRRRRKRSPGTTPRKSRPSSRSPSPASQVAEAPQEDGPGSGPGTDDDKDDDDDDHDEDDDTDSDTDTGINTDGDDVVVVDVDGDGDDVEQAQEVPSASDHSVSDDDAPAVEAKPSSLAQLRDGGWNDADATDEPPVYRYESVVACLLDNRSKMDPAEAKLLFVPEDEISVVTWPKAVRTNSSVKPPNFERLETSVQDYFNFFATEWIVVSQPHAKFIPHASDVGIDALPDEDYQLSCDAPPSTNSSEEGFHLLPEPLAPNLVRKLDSSFRDRAQHRRRQHRMEILRSIRPFFDWSPLTSVLGNKTLAASKRNPSLLKTFKQPDTIRFKVEAGKLDLAFGELEPFFCSLALYDLASETKLSEDFYFDSNCERVDVLLLQHRQWDKDPRTTSKTAIFSVASPSPDVYLVLQIRRVLQSDLDSLRDYYVKAFKKEKDADKARLKCSKVIAECCAKLGKYSQLFGWSALKVFDGIGNLTLDRGSVFGYLYTVDSKVGFDVFRMLTMMEQDKLTKWKRLRGSCDIKVTRLAPKQVLPNTVDPSLEFVHMKRDVGSSSDAASDVATTVDSEQPFLREVEEFSQQPLLLPHLEYVSNLYVYPEQVDLSSVRFPGKANVCIRVEMRENDRDPTPLPSLYGRSSSPALHTEHITYVVHGSKQPTWAEEVKVKLPHRLFDHHLVFTFYTVNAALKSKDSLETILGYAVLPLYEDSIFAVNNCGDHHTMRVIQADLPPCENRALPSGYMRKLRSSFAYVAQGAPVFRLRLRLLSTTVPMERNLATFYKYYHLKEFFADPELADAMANLDDLDTVVGIQSLPVCIQGLLRVMCIRSGEPGLVALETLLVCLTKFQHRLNCYVRPRMGTLQAYVEYAFDNVRGCKLPVYHALVSNWVVLNVKLRSQGDPRLSYVDMAWISWWIFDTVHKSMVIDCTDATAAAAAAAASGLGSPRHGDKPREQRFDFGFVRLLKKLLQQLVGLCTQHLEEAAELEASRQLNVNLGVFLRDAFTVMDRGHVLDMVLDYVTLMEREARIECASPLVSVLKCDVLRLVVDGQQYVPLCLPVPVSYGSDAHTPLIQPFSDAHPLSTALCGTVVQALCGANLDVTSVRAHVNMLHLLFVKLENDSRYQDPLCKHRVAQLHVPLLLFTVERWADMDAFANDDQLEPERQAFHSCVLWLLQHVEPSLLRELLTRMGATAKSTVFMVLVAALEAFEYEPGSPLVNVPSAQWSKTLVSAPRSGRKQGASRGDSGKGKSVPRLPSSRGNEHRAVGSATTASPSGSAVVGVGSAGGPDDAARSAGKELRAAALAPSTTYLDSPRRGRKAPRPPSGDAGASLADEPDDLAGGTAKASPEAPPSSSKRRGPLASVVTGSSRMSRVVLRSGPELESHAAKAASQVALLVLDFVETYRDWFAGELLSQPEGEHNAPRNALFQVYVALLACNQSTRVLRCLFDSLYSVCHDWQHVIFGGRNAYAGSLCHQVLRWCNNASADVRAEACLFFYELIKLNQAHTGRSFDRISMHSTIALSSLVDENALAEGYWLKRSLATIAAYALHDFTQPTWGALRATTDQVNTASSARGLEEEMEDDADDDATSASRRRGGLLLEEMEEEGDGEEDEEEDATLALVRQGNGRSGMVPVDTVDALAGYAKGTFARQVQELSFTLTKVLRDTIRVRDVKKSGNPERIAELYHRVADGYSHTPTLRASWLSFLQAFHRDEGNFAEAAVCHVHIAALIEDYLSQTGQGVDFDNNVFRFVAPTMLEYAEVVEDDVTTADVFTEATFTANIQSAADMFAQGLLYEFSDAIYQALLPLHERKHDYVATAACHRNMATYYDILWTKGDARALGKYYRVGFYGTPFGDRSGVEYVYKEPLLTHLYELKDRLLALCSAQGLNNVTVAASSDPVDAEAIPHGHGVIQITSLTPIVPGFAGQGGEGLEEDSGDEDDDPIISGGSGGSKSSRRRPRSDSSSGDTDASTAQQRRETEQERYVRQRLRLDRSTHFGQHVRLTRFSFDTPFVRGGDDRDKRLSTQEAPTARLWLRRTVVTVDEPFPYLLKRQVVSNKRVFELTPLQVAIESLTQHAARIAAEVDRPKPVINVLQQLLAGSVIPSVNKGPLEYAQTFLGPTTRNTYPAANVAKLRKVFRQFLAVCGRGLVLSHRLAKSDQAALQAKLEEGFDSLKAELRPYVTEAKRA